MVDAERARRQIIDLQNPRRSRAMSPWLGAGPDTPRPPYCPNNRWQFEGPRPCLEIVWCRGKCGATLSRSWIKPQQHDALDVEAEDFDGDGYDSTECAQGDDELWPDEHGEDESEDCAI